MLCVGYFVLKITEIIKSLIILQNGGLTLLTVEVLQSVPIKDDRLHHKKKKKKKKKKKRAT